MAIVSLNTSISQNITLEAGGVFIHRIEIGINSQTGFSLNLRLIKNYVAISISNQSTSLFLPFLKIGPSIQIASQSDLTPLAKGIKYSFVSPLALSDTTFDLNARWFSVEFDCNSFVKPLFMLTKPFDVVMSMTINAQSNTTKSINIIRYIETIIGSQSSVVQEIFVKWFLEFLAESSSVFDADLIKFIKELETQIAASSGVSYDLKGYYKLITDIISQSNFAVTITDVPWIEIERIEEIVKTAYEAAATVKTREGISLTVSLD